MSTTTHQGAVGAETMTAGDPVTILYTNYRGETAVRRIVPGSEHPGLGALWLGETEWHPGTQWLLAARDVEKDAHRVFALSGIKAWGQAAVDAALSTPAPRTDGGMTAGEDHFGYLFHNPDTGEEWSENHPVESGEVEDAENVRPATAKALHELLIEAWSELEDARADLATPAQPAGAVPEGLRALSEAATQGEWRINRLGDKEMSHVVDMGEPPKAPYIVLRKGMAPSSGFTGWSAKGICHSDDGSSAANAAFIVAAVNFVRALLASDPPGQSAGSGADRDQVDAGLIQMLIADNARMRAAGTKLSEASLRVIREYDGTHRLSLAVAEWAEAIADEGGRADRFKPGPDSTRTGDEGTEGLPWRDMKTAPTDTPIIAKHKPNSSMPHGWVATIILGHDDDERVGSLDTILHYNGDALYRGFHGCWDGWLPVEALAARPAAPEAQGAWHWTDREGHPVRDAEQGEQWLLTWSEASATYDINCIDGDWPHGDAIKLLCMDAWKWIEASPPAPPASSGQEG